MAGQFKTEHVATTPRGWKVKTVARGKHRVRVAFPPGRRVKGSGQLVEILHPASEKNPRCIAGEAIKKNPGELLIFGNPAPATEPTKLEKQRAARERAAQIREARINTRKKKNARHPGSYSYDVVVTGGDSKRTRRHGPYSRQDAEKFAAHFRDQLRKKGELKKTSVEVKPHKEGLISKLFNPKRRNPSESKQAVRLFQGFHGHDPKEIIEKHVSAAVRLDYTALGDLVYLKVITPIGGKASFYFEDDGVKLSASPDGKQLYCIGGNQNILPCLDEDSKQKDLIDLGDAVEVAYLARKIHGQFRPIEYFHKFGEIDGTLPRLAFDKLRKQIFFFGGNYWIDVNMPAPGTPLGKISPGIEN